MNIDDFQDLVDRCGERPEDWPADVRAEATLFLAGSRQAQEIVAEAASLRGLFAEQPQERAPEPLANRIVALAERMDDLRPTVNHDLRRRVRFGKDALSGGTPAGETLPPGGGRGRPLSPKMYLWFAAVFVSGLGLGIAGTMVSMGRHIDFATLFAVIS